MAVLNSPDNWRMVKKARETVVMALFLIFRPIAGVLEPIMRPDLVLIWKMKAEGRLAEIIIYLGWLTETRRFIIAIPINKWKAWPDIISLLL